MKADPIVDTVWRGMRAHICDQYWTHAVHGKQEWCANQTGGIALESMMQQIMMRAGCLLAGMVIAGAAAAANSADFEYVTGKAVGATIPLATDEAVQSAVVNCLGTGGRPDEWYVLGPISSLSDGSYAVVVKIRCFKA